MNGSYEPLVRVCRSVILDTDIGPDCDDAGAIALLCGFSKSCGFDISAVINCTSNPYGNGAAEAIMSFCGVNGVSQGRFCRRSFLRDSEKYNRYVSEKYAPEYIAGGLFAEDSLEVYRKALTDAKDKSVTVVTIGQFNALAEILASEPKLCADKIYSVVSMAGSFDESVEEYNVVCDVQGAKLAFETLAKLGIPHYLISLEMGSDVITGFSHDDGGDDPLRDSYRLYTDGRMRRNSWDLIAVHFAVMGECDYYRIGETGRAEVFQNGGMKIWENEDGLTSFVRRKTDADTLAEHLDRYLDAAGKN